MPAESILSVAFSRDGQTLAAGGFGVIHLWDVPSFELARTLDNVGWIASLAFGPDGQHFAAGDFAGVQRLGVRLWDARTFDLEALLQ